VQGVGEAHVLGGGLSDPVPALEPPPPPPPGPLQPVEATPMVAVPLIVQAAALQGSIPRGMFPVQAQWHVAVSYRALLQCGHRFNLPGSSFDLGEAKPCAPQCNQCFVTFAKSKLHSLAKSGVACVPVVVVVNPPLVGPQRLDPPRPYQLGGVTFHHTHSFGHFRGRLWCTGCAATMAVTSRPAPSFLRPCPGKIAEDTARRNLTHLVGGSLPPGWATTAPWPRGLDFGLRGFVSP
jgi:hypothetical protein